MISWTQGIRIAARNGPFLSLLAANFLERIGSAANLAAVIRLFEKGLALGEGAGLPLVVYLLTAVLGAPLWIWVGHIIPKHQALIIASLSGIAAFSVLFFLPPGQLMLTTLIMAAAGIAGRRRRRWARRLPQMLSIWMPRAAVRRVPVCCWRIGV